MDPNSALGELLEKNQNIVKATVSDVTNSFKGQVLGDKKVSQSSQQLSPQIQQPASGEPFQNSTDYTREVVGDFYAPSENIAQSSQSAQSFQNDQANLTKIRQELQSLHNEVYYKPLFAYEEKKPEKRLADKIEEEDQAKMMDLQQKEAEKTPPIALQRAQTSTEINRGVSG